MGLQLEFGPREYIIHDRRSIPGEDAIYRAAVELTDEIMAGIRDLNIPHSLEIAILFITDQDTVLMLVTRSLETEPTETRLDSVLKRVTHDPHTGSLYTYVIPILETVSPENPIRESDDKVGAAT